MAEDNIVNVLIKKLIARECDRMRKKFSFFTLTLICSRSECGKNSSYGKTCSADRNEEVKKSKVGVWVIGSHAEH